MKAFLILMCAAFSATSLLGQAFRIETFNLGIANVHYLESNGVGILIDSGEHGQEEKLLRKMNKRSIGAPEVDFILLTHGHADHAGGAKLLSEILNAEIIAGEADSLHFRKGHNPPLHATSRLGSWVDKHIVKKDDWPIFHIDHPVKGSFPLAEMLPLITQSGLGASAAVRSACCWAR